MGALTSSIEGEYIVQIFKKLFLTQTFIEIILVHNINRLFSYGVIM